MHFKMAVETQDALPYREPEFWYYPTRQSLGHALMLSKNFKEAVSVFNQDLKDYPRTDILIDSDRKLYEELLKTGNENFFYEQKIFIIDPYGRAVMFFPVSMDPKLILKDLKVLI